MRKVDVKERRAHPRHAAELQVQGSEEDGGVVARMVTRDLSLGGLYCTSSTDFPEMTQLAVRLMLPIRESREDLVPMELEAIVVRREELPSSNGHPRYELGLFFQNMESATVDQLRHFLSDGA